MSVGCKCSSNDDVIVLSAMIVAKDGRKLLDCYCCY